MFELFQQMLNHREQLDKRLKRVLNIIDDEDFRLDLTAENIPFETHVIRDYKATVQKMGDDHVELILSETQKEQIDEAIRFMVKRLFKDKSFTDTYAAHHVSKYMTSRTDFEFFIMTQLCNRQSPHKSPRARRLARPKRQPYALISQPKRRLAKQYVPIRQVMDAVQLREFAVKHNLIQIRRFGVGVQPMAEKESTFEPLSPDKQLPIVYVDKIATVSDFDTSNLDKKQVKWLREQLDNRKLNLKIKSTHPPYRRIHYIINDEYVIASAEGMIELLKLEKRIKICLFMTEIIWMESN